MLLNKIVTDMKQLTRHAVFARRKVLMFFLTAWLCLVILLEARSAMRGSSGRPAAHVRRPDQTLEDRMDGIIRERDEKMKAMKPVWQRIRGREPVVDEEEIFEEYEERHLGLEEEEAREEGERAAANLTKGKKRRNKLVPLRPLRGMPRHKDVGQEQQLDETDVESYDEDYYIEE